MTIAQMHTLADLLIDKANAPWFNPSEKDIYLNLAINEYTKNKYRAFEVDEKVREDLLTLVQDGFSVAATNIINLDVVTDFLFILRLDGDILNSPCGPLTGVPITPMQHDDFAESQRDPFNNATDKNPEYTMAFTTGTRKITVFCPTLPSIIRMVYLSQPVTVSITAPTNCNLPPHTHEEIVNLAVRKMLGTIEAMTNYQIQQNEINHQE